MQKNKIEYGQIINKIDKLTCDSLLDSMIPERVVGINPNTSYLLI